MAPSIAILGMLLWIVWWALVFSMCVALYRAVRLPSLPWIAAYFAVAIVAVPLMQYYGHRIAVSGHVPQRTPNGSLPDAFLGSPLALAASVATAFDYAGDLLIITLAFAEAAVLVRRVHPDASSKVLQALAAIHAHTRAVGLIAIVLTALLPVPAMIYLYTHP